MWHEPAVTGKKVGGAVRSFGDPTQEFTWKVQWRVKKRKMLCGEVVDMIDSFSSSGRSVKETCNKLTDWKSRTEAKDRKCVAGLSHLGKISLKNIKTQRPETKVMSIVSQIRVVGLNGGVNTGPTKIIPRWTERGLFRGQSTEEVL